MESIRIVTRADDAAMSSTVNRAIRASVRQGIVRNISVLACGPSLNSAADNLVDLADHVDFGFHACLTAEWANLRWKPILDPGTVPSIVREDHTFAFTLDELRELEPKRDHVMQELEAQYQRLTEYGFPITYVDEHMLIGRIDVVGECLAAFAEQHGLISDRELSRNGALAPLPDWGGPGAHPGTELADHLSMVPPGTYLLVGHPAFKSEEMERIHAPGGASGEVLYTRNRQRRMFADIEIVDYCDNVGIELLRYRQLSE